MEPQDHLNLRILKSNIRAVNLEKFLPLYFAELLDHTINTSRLAIELKNRRIMSLQEMHRCLNEPKSFYQNMELYKTIMKKNAGEALVDALIATKNFCILQLLQGKLENFAQRKISVHDDAQVDQKSLEKLLKPHFSQILDTMVNTSKIALQLYKKGAITREQRNQCISTLNVSAQNREVIQTVVQNDAGDEFIDALRQTQNFYILQLLRPNSDQSVPALSPMSSSSSTSKCGSTQISVLSSSAESNLLNFETMWVQDEWLENLRKTHQLQYENTLALIVTTTCCPDDYAFKSFQSTEFDLEEAQSIFKFIESTLGLNLDNKTMAKSLQEIYINTRSFTPTQWEEISKLLYVNCRDSLERLWLNHVTTTEYLEGVGWMKFLESDVESNLRFKKLKMFVFNGIVGQIDENQLNAVLSLIKSKKLSIDDLWNESNIRIRLGTIHGNECYIDVDPAKGILVLGPLDPFLQNRFLRLLGSRLSSLNNQTNPVKRFMIHRPILHVVELGRNLELLTHLSIECWKLEEIQVIESVCKKLSEFQSLAHLSLGTTGSNTWNLKLEDLNVLEHLLFLYLMQANVDSKGIGLERFPWKRSVQTVTLMCSKFRLKSKSVCFSHNQGGLVMEREGETSFRINEISLEDGKSSRVHSFYK